MRHAAPHATSGRKLGRAGQLALALALAVAVYAVAALSICTITLTAALTLWSLWQWLGVN